MGSPLDVQFLGMIRTDNISEIDRATALSVEATIDPGFVAAFARAHEAAKLDWGSEITEMSSPNRLGWESHPADKGLLVAEPTPSLR